MAAFTSIAAGIGLATAAATTGMSFAQAGKQKKMENKARKEANTAMKEARARLEVNYADALSIPKEAYELEREAMLVQGAQALEAGIESERGGAATAGRVLASQQQAQAGVRTAMATDIFDLEAMKAEEDSRLRDINVQMDIGEAMGAQQRAADAQAAATAAKNQGIEGAINLAGDALEMIPLYVQDNKAQKYAAGQSGYSGTTNKDWKQYKKDTPNFQYGEEYQNAYKRATDPFNITSSKSAKTYKDYTQAELQEMKTSNPVLFEQLAKDYMFKDNLR
jgi:hypothetical protein